MANWTKAKESDERSKCLVFGFVRESQKLLDNNESHVTISPLIIWIILSFCCIKDEWDTKYTDKSYEIVGDLLRKGKNTGAKTAIMKHAVSKGR